MGTFKNINNNTDLKTNYNSQLSLLVWINVLNQDLSKVHIHILLLDDVFPRLPVSECTEASHLSEIRNKTQVAEGRNETL